MMERMPIRMPESSAWRLVVAATIILLFALVALVLDAKPAFAAGTVNVSVQGKGDVSGEGINCNETGGPDCSEFYANTTTEECDPELRPPCIIITEFPFVTLTANDRAGTGFTFDGWTGCDTITARSCDMTVTADRSVTASFRDAQAPSVTNLSPSSGVQRGTISIGASASDNSGSLNRVEFRVRGALIATDTTAPYSTSFNTATVADGSATIQATAFDAAGNSSSTPATSNITIDNTAPTLNITGGPDGQTFGPGSTQTWTFSAGDATSGVASVQCSVVATGSPASFGTCSGGSGSHSVSNRPDGSYTLTVRVRDNGGLETTRSRTFSIDATAPNTTITSGVADGGRTNQTTLTWGFSSSEASSTFECRIYPAALTPPAFGPCSAAGSHSATGFAPGTYTFEVRATDAVGNLDGAPANRTFTIDTTAPTVTNVTPAADATDVAVSDAITATFSEAIDASTLTSANFTLTRQDGTFVNGQVNYDSISNTATFFLGELEPSTTYTATVKSGASGVKDQAENPLAADRVWSFRTAAPPDTTPPDTSITSGLADGARTNRTTLTWGFTSSEAGSTFGCRVYRTSSAVPAFGACSAAGSHTVAGLTSGTYAFEVRATDASGNVDGSPARRTFTIDTVKPRVGSVTPRHLAKGVAPTANVTATFSEAMNRATLNRTTFKLVRKGTRVPVAATVSYSGNRAILNPSRSLVRGATYTATVTTGTRDLAGNPLAANKVWKFTVRR